MEDYSVAMRNKFVRRMYWKGIPISEIVRMLKDIDEGEIVKIVGVEVIYGDRGNTHPDR